MAMASTVGTAPFYASRPTVLIGGQVNGELSVGLLTMLVQETTEGLYACEVSFGNWGTTPSGDVGTLYADRALLDFGVELALRVGDSDTEAVIFAGRIMGLEAHYPQTRPPEIVVLAEDRLQDLRMTRRTRTFEDVTDEDVIAQIASEHSLQSDVSLTGPTHTVLAQVNQSDLAFVRERARACGAEAWVIDSTLYVLRREDRTGDPIRLTYGQNLIEFSVMADLANQRTGLTVSGWDVRAKEAISHEATPSILSSELNGRQSGAQILQDTLGARKEMIVHHAPANTREAQVLAEAEFRQIARQFVTGTGITDGDGRIQVGATIEIGGLDDMFNGRYYVVEVSHMFDNTFGYQTRFRVERAGI